MSAMALFTRPRSFAITILAITILAASAGLVGCAGFPGPGPQPRIKSPDQYASERSFEASAAAWPGNSWWTAYGDPQLNQLIAEALDGSPSVAVAEARLRHARSVAEVAGSALEPQVSTEASATEQRQSYDYLSPRAVTPQGWKDYGRATLDVSWELDLWGKNRAALAAATSEAAAAQVDAAQARLTLAAAIASAYAELAREYAALDTAQAALRVRTSTAELFERRRENGLETLGSLRQVESHRAAAEADVLSSEEQLALQKNRISALIGAGPDRGLAIARPGIDLAHPFGLPDRLAADLLGRRPDIVAARMRVDAAGKRIAQARAAFYPNVNLLTFAGAQSIGLNMLTQGDSSIGSIGPAISLPLFDGGRLRGQLRSAEADYAEAVASYDGTLVQALKDVADAVTSQKALGGQIARTDEAVEAAREAWRIQNNRYEGGLSTYLEVLAAEDTLLTNLRAQSDLRSRSFALDVALAHALGGGFATTLN
jgi:NodT family efflux transporter outer membrane factor (OMF) lipoprotein